MLSKISKKLYSLFNSSKIKVAVHDGSFHTDDVFAVAILSLYIKKPLDIFRTRDHTILEKMDYVFDVGGEYDPEKKIFDHHQAGWNEKRKNGIVYSSAGLAWKEFGEKITGSQDIADQIDKKIIQGIDADDNGIDLYQYNFPGVKEYAFSDYIYSLNPTYYEKSEDTLDIFKKAVKEARKILEREIKVIGDLVYTEKIIKEIYNKTEDKRLLILDDDYSWERIIGEFKEPLLIIKPVANGARWILKCVPVSSFEFKNKLDLPESWAGKIGEDLQKVTGVKDATFCHRSRFIAGAKSKEGIIELAKKVLANSK